MKKLYLLSIVLIMMFKAEAQPFNQAVYFDGANRAEFPAALLSTLSVFTIEFWIRTTDLRTSGTYYNRPQIIGNASAGAASNDFAINMSGGYIGMWNGLGAGDASMLSAQFISDNRWHHIAASNNGTNVTLYVDGVSVGSATSGGPITTTLPANIQLSGHTNSAGTAKGIFFIDELRVSNNVRYSANFTPPSAAFATGANTIGLYHMDACGAGLVDATANVYTATFTGTCINTTTARSPGSGNSINFAGANLMTINNIAYDDFTMEMWYNTTQTGTTGAEAYSGNRLIDNDVVGVSNDMVPMSLVGSKLAFGTGNGGAPNAYHSLYSTTNINDGKWHHLAITRVSSTGEKRLYVDGILEATAFATTGSLNGMATLLVGEGNGNMDELRIWNTVLTQTEIRNFMCRKVRGSHTKFNNLVTYLNFDDGTTTRIADTKSNNHGVLTGAPVMITSGAPIGNDQASSFAGAASSVNLTTPVRGDGLTATLTSGSAAGIIAYRVDEYPNTMANAIGIGNNDTYYGVFVVGGTTPNYNAVYNYSGLSFSSYTEPYLQLFRRADNAVTSWTNASATQNMGANTLTVSGTQSEYIVGSSSWALPVNLLNFQAGKIDAGTNIINWQTSMDKEVAHFILEKSRNGIEFTSIYKLEGKPDMAELQTYSYTDAEHDATYYRLKIIDRNNFVQYSKIIKVVSEKLSAKIYALPNPTRGALKITGLKGKLTTIKLISLEGRTVKQETTSLKEYQLDIQAQPSGMYWIQVIDDQTTVIKIVKQ